MVCPFLVTSRQTSIAVGAKEKFRKTGRSFKLPRSESRRETELDRQIEREREREREREEKTRKSRIDTRRINSSFIPTYEFVLTRMEFIDVQE